MLVHSLEVSLTFGALTPLKFKALNPTITEVLNTLKTMYFTTTPPLPTAKQVLTILIHISLV